MRKEIAANSGCSSNEGRWALLLITKKISENSEKSYDHYQTQDHGGLQWMRNPRATEHVQKFQKN